MRSPATWVILSVLVSLAVGSAYGQRQGPRGDNRRRKRDVRLPSSTERKVIDGFVAIQQPDSISCGPTACQIVLSRYRLPPDAAVVRREAMTDILGFSTPVGLARGMARLGLEAEYQRGGGTIPRLVSLLDDNRPAILPVRTGKQMWHYIVVIGYEDYGRRLVIADPGNGKIDTLPSDNVGAGWRYWGDYSTGAEIGSPVCVACGGDGRLVKVRCLCNDGRITGEKIGMNLDCPFCENGKWTFQCTICGGNGTSTDVNRKAVELAVPAYSLLTPDRAVP